MNALAWVCMALTVSMLGTAAWILRDRREPRIRPANPEALPEIKDAWHGEELP